MMWSTPASRKAQVVGRSAVAGGIVISTCELEDAGMVYTRIDKVETAVALGGPGSKIQELV